MVMDLGLRLVDLCKEFLDLARELEVRKILTKKEYEIMIEGKKEFIQRFNEKALI